LSLYARYNWILKLRGARIVVLVWPDVVSALAQAKVPLGMALCAGQHIDVTSLDGRILRVPLKEARPVCCAGVCRLIVSCVTSALRPAPTETVARPVLDYTITCGSILPLRTGRTLTWSFTFRRHWACTRKPHLILDILSALDAQVEAPGMDRVVKGEGMPLSRAPGQKGDLHIKIDVQFPSRQARARRFDATKETWVQGRGSWRLHYNSHIGTQPSHVSFAESQVCVWFWTEVGFVSGRHALVWCCRSAASGCMLAR